MSQHPIEKLWREQGLPEWFLGNGESNTKLYALYDAILAELMPILPPIPVQFVNARGETFEEMRANVFADGLGEIGDAMLIWVNQGDFLHLQVNGGAVAVSEGIGTDD